MYESHYNIAGISIVITAKCELIDDEAYRLYRTDGITAKGDPEDDDAGHLYRKEGITSDQVYRITLVESTDRPDPSCICLFQNELNWVFAGGDDGDGEAGGEVTQHFFRVPYGKMPCAWDKLDHTAKKTLYYLPEAERYFSTAMGVFNASGFERILYHYKKYLYHCSYVDAHGKAVLFSAPSGGGKTTQGMLWEKYADATMINGDRAVLEMTEDGVLCHGLPIAGSSGVFINRTLPLAAIFTLKKAQENRVRILRGKEAFLAVYSQLTVNLWDQEFVQDALDFSMLVAERIPIYELSCTISEEAVRVAEEWLRKGWQR